MSEEALQIVEERSKVKARGKGKERYTQLNAELLRIVRRDKKAFLNEKSEEIEKITRQFSYDLNQISYNYTVEVMNRFKG